MVPDRDGAVAGLRPGARVEPEYLRGGRVALADRPGTGLGEHLAAGAAVRVEEEQQRGAARCQEAVEPCRIGPGRIEPGRLCAGGDAHPPGAVRLRS